MSKKSGYISVWFAAKYFGFVHENRGGKLFKYFLHASNVLEGNPETGSRVLFNEGSNNRGLLALDVEVLVPHVPPVTITIVPATDEATAGLRVLASPEKDGVTECK